MRYNIKPQVCIDWNNDGFFCKYAKQGDGLNLIPYALHLYGMQYQAYDDAVLSVEAQETDYGLQVFYVTTIADPFGGLLFGQGAGGVNGIPASPSTTYRFTFWVYRALGSTLGWTINARDEEFAFLGTTTFTPTGSWQQVSISFTTLSTTSKLYFDIVKSNNAAVGTFGFAGWMLTAGSGKVQGYNTGAISDFYENITSDVLDAHWETGITDQQTRVPDEGIANFTVNNTTRRYSPRLTTSPIYGLLKKQLRVSIEVQNLSTTQYITTWMGYTKDYSIHAGTHNPTIDISCEQGMFALDSSSPSFEVMENTTASEAMKEILNRSSFKPAHTPYGFYLDRSRLDLSWVGGYAAVGGTPMIVTPADPDPVDLPLVGDGWMNSSTSPRKMLEDIVEVDQGYLFMQNNGQLKYMDRKEIQDATPLYDISIDYEIHKTEYSHAEYMINKASVSYYPNATEDDVILWSTRQPLKINRGKTKTVKVEFKYNDKDKMTVTAVNPFSGVATPSVLTAVNTAGTPVTVGIVPSYNLENGTATLYIKNNTTNTVFVSLVLKGSRQIQVDSERVELAADEVDTTVDTLNVDNRLLRDEEMAFDLANYYISTYHQPYDQFKKLTIKPRNSTILGVGLALWPGTVITLSEYQTNVEKMRHLVVGCAGDYRPGKDLTLSVYLNRADLSNDYIVGTTKLGDGGELAY